MAIGFFLGMLYQYSAAGASLKKYSKRTYTHRQEFKAVPDISSAHLQGVFRVIEERIRVLKSDHAGLEEEGRRLGQCTQAGEECFEAASHVMTAVHTLTDLVEALRTMPIGNTLEKVIASIQEHDRLHPNHGVGCACHDVHAGAIRQLYKDMNEKSKRNLMTVLGYVTRNP